MLSAVERYQLRLRAALARYFPRTTAYLRAEREAASTIAQASLAPPRRQSQPRQPKRATQGQPQTSRKPSGAKPASKKAKSAIYGPTLLPVTPAQSQTMRERVGALGGTLVDERLAGRVSLYSEERDGFTHNLSNDQTYGDVNKKAVRVQFLAKLNPDLEALWKIHGRQFKGDGSSGSLRR